MEEQLKVFMAGLGYKLKPAVKDHREVERYESRDPLQNISKDLAEHLYQTFTALIQEAENRGYDKRKAEESGLW